MDLYLHHVHSGVVRVILSFLTACQANSAGFHSCAAAFYNRNIISTQMFPAWQKTEEFERGWGGGNLITIIWIIITWSYSDFLLQKESLSKSI